MIKICLQCGIKFEPSDNRTKTCSRRCGSIRANSSREKKGQTRKCGLCSKSFYVWPGDLKKNRRFCSFKCWSDFKNPDGYKTCRSDGVTVRTHRYVASKVLGRRLKTSELVHHIDEQKPNNNPANLVVVSRSEHARYHRALQLGKSHRLIGIYLRDFTR